MATDVQVQYRRRTAAQLPSFTGALGELIIDTTNNRVTVHDGSTAGGWPAARLSEIGGGDLNRFRNGTMDVWQRGTSSIAVSTAAAYTADGWIVLPTGASVTAAQAGGRLLTKNSLQVTGASSVTDVIIKQRIESLMAAAFCSQTVTVQAQVYNNTGGAITPKLTVNHAGSQDSWASPTTDVSAVSLQACASGGWTLVAYTFQANANSYNGLEVIFDFGNTLGSSSKSVQIAECDIRVTNGVPTGLNANPPAVELRPITVELAANQRYFSSSFGNGVTPANSTAGFWDGALFWYATNSAATQNIQFPVPMRTAPTVTLYSSNNGSSPAAGQWQYYNGSAWNNMSSSTPVSSSITVNGFIVSGNATGTAGTANFASGHWTASAEL